MWHAISILIFTEKYGKLIFVRKIQKRGKTGTDSGKVGCIYQKCITYGIYYHICQVYIVKDFGEIVEISFFVQSMLCIMILVMYIIAYSYHWYFSKVFALFVRFH